MASPDAPALAWDTYEVFGERFSVGTASDEARGLGRRSWAPFLTPDPTPTGSTALFHLAVSSATSPLTEWQFFNNGNLLVIADDRRLVTGYLYRAPWRFHVTAYRQAAEFAYYYLLEPLCRMVLMRRGLVQWHSAAVARGGAAVLIVGPSGSGKSTTALQLIRAGFHFLADDDLFLRRREAAVDALGAGAELYVTDRTVTMFPDLGAPDRWPLVQRGHAAKRRLAMAPACPGTPTSAGAVPVRAILFPRVGDGETVLRPLSAREALARCLAQQPKEYPTMVTDAAALATQLDTYVTLARTVRSFDVTLGRDASRLSDEVAERLA